MRTQKRIPCAMMCWPKVGWNVQAGVILAIGIWLMLAVLTGSLAGADDVSPQTLPQRSIPPAPAIPSQKVIVSEQSDVVVMEEGADSPAEQTEGVAMSQSASSYCSECTSEAPCRACDVCCTPLSSRGCCLSSLCNPIQIGGWVSAGGIANAWGNQSNGPMMTMRERAETSIDQVWVFAEKDADNCGYGINWGGRVDYVFGADAIAAQTVSGWDSQWDTSDDGVYGSAMPQAYTELAVDNWRIKTGHFFTNIGYEVIPAVDNFFYSHSYALAYEPFTHLGTLAEYQCGPNLTLQGGWVNGWDEGEINVNGGSMFLGGGSLQLFDNLSATYACSIGDLNHQPNTSNNGECDKTYMHSLVFEWEVCDRLTYVLQSDFRNDTQYDYTNTFSGRSASGRYYGLNSYFLYEMCDCVDLGVRAEWFRTEDETWNTGTSQFDMVTRNFSEVTLGMNYRPLDFVCIRPEVRWDWSEGRPTSPMPYHSNTRSWQFSGGLDMYVVF